MKPRGEDDEYPEHRTALRPGAIAPDADPASHAAPEKAEPCGASADLAAYLATSVPRRTGRHRRRTGESAMSDGLRLESIASRQELMALTLDGCRVAYSAASAAAEAIAHGAPSAFRMVRAMEQRLDALDREIDQRAAAALIETDVSGARELLSCCKIMVDLERIGDLLMNFINRTESVRTRIEMADAES